MNKRAGSRGMLFVISAPSGCGKTTLCQRLLNDDLGLAHSISATTRPPRKGEKNGIDYRFVSPAVFSRMVERGEFLEHEENFGNRYGTPRRAVEVALAGGKNVLLNIDVKGAMHIKREYRDKSVIIFILPPSTKALKSRLTTRSLDGRDEMERRLKVAKKEMSYKDRYDYRIVNDRLDVAYRKLKKVIMANTGGVACTE